MNRKAEERHAYREFARLYNDSVQDKKTYSKLLRLMRSDEKERVVKYLEALLGAAAGAEDAVKDHVSEEIRSRVNSGVLDYMGDYNDANPPAVDNAPNN